MLDQGDTTQKIVTFMMGAIFAGIINTGINICWILLFLDANPEWNASLQTELETLLSEYSPDSSLPIHARLSHIPIDAWEDSTPVLEAIIQETIRVIVNGGVLRRNLMGDVNLDGKTVKQGDFMVYPLEDAHLDPEIYPEPSKWNPGRWLKDQEKTAEQQKAHWTFLGWGVGMHPCLGMRFAKLEMKLIAAMYTQAFDYTRVDAQGNRCTGPVPEPDRNDLYRQTPKGIEILLEYKRKV